MIRDFFFSVVEVVALLTLMSPTALSRQSDPPHGDIPYFGGCVSCHDPNNGGAADGTVTCLWCHGENPLFPQYNATRVKTHSSAVTGTSSFDYTLECTACHQPHDQEQNNAFGTFYGKYIHDTIDESITVTNYRVWPSETFITNVLSPIEFTDQFQFIDGDGEFTEDICSTCHTQTNHHQNDGTAPYGQFHNDGTNCTSCHAHDVGFTPTEAPPPPPHDQFGCTACHQTDAQGNLIDAFPGAPISSAKCGTCHAPGSPGNTGGGSDLNVVSHYSDNYIDPNTGLLASLECVECHNPMRQQVNFRGNPNLVFVRNMIRGVPVTFESTKGPYSFAYDLPNRPGDMFVENYICNTCHTQTNHHQNGGWAPGGQEHYDGLDCTACHSHEGGFRSVGGAHLQAQTDCSNCHLDPASGQPDLTGLHGGDCDLCHTTNFSPPTFTFLGPLGSWDQECSACHNPAIDETGNLDEPTKGHRCIACHGHQLSTSNVRQIHEEHTGKADCDVCHGFVPHTEVAIGSGNRENCDLCHGTSQNGSSMRELHGEMVPEGLDCIECHSDGRPPVDVFPGPPVGNSDHVCQVCHSNRHPSEFWGDSEDLHKEHTDHGLGCGACHKDANLQGDHDPMPSFDDPRRQLVNRAGENDCYFCHKGGRSGSITSVHERHGKHWQWCFNCHDGDDERPLGLVPPITEPRQACALCHNNRSYEDSFPFNIHEEHAGGTKCYACHQAVAPLFDWPQSWMDSGGGGSGDYTTLPYSTGFESGALDQFWSVVQGSEGRILVTTSNGPYAGNYHLTMDDYNDGGAYSQNEAWLHLDLTGESQVALSFEWKEFKDETHSQDGVYFSDDGGANFTKVSSLSGGSHNWQTAWLDLDALAAGAGLSLSSTFVVKLQQYDDDGIAKDGMAFDNVSVD